MIYFSCHELETGAPPDWFRNPMTGKRIDAAGTHWSALQDFDAEIGDIKVIWEPSRFDWALVFARAYRHSGDLRYLRSLNEWCRDWITKNPLNSGPNWMCGQETGIRMLQLLLAAFLLRQHRQPAKALVRFVFEHCGRIEPTVRYALAQDNNHGTSEAAALFIGGGWLELHGASAGYRHQAERWKDEGRKWLENRVARLIGEDGSFSQHSLNYHRLLVETLNQVEFWRRELSLEEFSPRFYQRSRAAVEWLYQMVDEKSGHAPNLGPNDGARLFPLAETDYRDYRPSVQLGAVLFLGRKVYPMGPWDEPIFWLDLQEGRGEKAGFEKRTRDFPIGGYVHFCIGEGTWGLLRYPRFRFRPAHADAFHFDLWHQGRNILRDSGSYSYADEPWKSYFSSTRAHNTIEFDGKDQMPSISRFLRGSWLELNKSSGLQEEKEKVSWSGSYNDYLDNKHKRTIEIQDKIVKIIDEIEGRFEKAVLRWRLIDLKWNIIKEEIESKFIKIKIESNKNIRRIEIVQGYESKYYLKKTPIPVLEVEIEECKAIITSEIQLLF
ncbi:MAG: alginate lyase family protein [Syntrophotaleaceae bacterium]